MELDKFKTMMNVRKRMTYFLRFQRMAGSENQVTIDEEAWELILPDQWNLSGEHEKAIREGVGDIRPRHQQHREQTSQKILYYPLLLHEEENSKRMFRNGRY